MNSILLQNRKQPYGLFLQDKGEGKTTLFETLKKTFGFSEFRPFQEEIVKKIIDSRDVFAVMPTGGGKSLCYQLPAKLLDGTVIVVSSLISLMKDQVDGAVETGIKAAYLNSSQEYEESRVVMQWFKKGIY